MISSGSAESLTERGDSLRIARILLLFAAELRIMVFAERVLCGSDREENAMKTLAETQLMGNDVAGWFDAGRQWLMEAWPKALQAVLIVLIGFLILKGILALFRRFLTRFQLDPSLKSFLASVFRITFGVIILISALSSLGIPTTSIIAAFSAAAVAVGLAMKDSLGNVAGGILLLFSKPFLTGDWVEVKGLSGTVTKVDIIYTTFNTFDNRQFVIPNGQLINETIINYSREEKRRCDLTYPVSYHTDVTKAKEILARLASENEKILKEPEPVIGVSRCGDNAVTLILNAWCRSGDVFHLMLEMNERVKIAFAEAGIEAPTAQIRIREQ